MNKLVNPDLIVVARESLGISQSELANRLKIDQGNLSKMENSLLSASDEIIEKIAKELKHPVSFFYEQRIPYPPNNIHYFRKAKSLPVKDFAMIRANIVKDRIRIEKLLDAVEFQTDYPSFSLDELESTETIANTLRELWRIPNGVIKNVTELLESKGIIIVPTDFGTRLISDITTNTEKGIFVIFLNSAMPPDRKRFTLCHVLGHIVMHNFSESKTIELEADRFAGEFLMPANDIRHQLIGLSLGKLADLKRLWKVSMAAILMRASHLGTITPQYSDRLWKQLAKRGYKLKEPFDIGIENEEPTLLNEIIDLHKNTLTYSDTQLIDFLYLLENDYSKYGINIRPKLRLIHFQEGDKQVN
jgi:Zn-dependent peptidase ImmA (M78 family)